MNRLWKKTAGWGVAGVLGVICLGGMLCLGGCDKAPINSDIEGHWRVLSIENRQGEEQPCENLFYSIQLQVVELAQKPATGGIGHLVGRVSYPEEGTLRLSDFLKSTGWADDGDTVTVEELRPFGLPALDNRLKVLKAGGKELILQTDSTTIRMKRF